MDLLDPQTELNLNDEGWKIYTEDTNVLPQYLGPDADIKRAYITQGCEINGRVTGSVLFTGAIVKKGAQVIDSVLMPGVVVEEDATVTRALVADGVRIGEGCIVGKAGSEHITLVASDQVLSAAAREKETEKEKDTTKERTVKK